LPFDTVARLPSRVLASVPGTQQAAEAVLLAQIPQTARVAKTTKAPDVAYFGAPQFQPIPSTTVARAAHMTAVKYGGQGIYGTI
jgi:hypothetical protein